MANPQVAIIIVHLDNQPALHACLGSCRAIRYSNYGIVVMDNGSPRPLDPDQLKGLAGRKPAIIRSPVNVGFARGSNLGIKAALAQGADYVLLLNDDTEVSAEFLDALVRTGEQHEHIGALGPKIYCFAEPAKLWFAGGRYNARTCQVVAPCSGEVDDGKEMDLIASDWLTGCCVLMKRQAIEKSGCFDERFFLYWEDTDWGLRLQASGFHNVVAPSARIWHKVSLSTGGAESALKAYHKTRSHLLFAQLHAPHALPAIQRKILWDIAWLLVKSSQPGRFRKALARGSAIRDYYRGRTDRGPTWLWQPP